MAGLQWDFVPLFFSLIDILQVVAILVVYKLGTPKETFSLKGEH